MIRLLAWLYGSEGNSMKHVELKHTEQEHDRQVASEIRAQIERDDRRMEEIDRMLTAARLDLELAQRKRGAQ